MLYVPNIILEEFHDFSRCRKALMLEISRAIHCLSDDVMELSGRIAVCNDDSERERLQQEHDERYEAIEWLDEVYESLDDVIS